MVESVCGIGPGTPCAADLQPACVDGQTLPHCAFGKLSAVDCEQQCREIGDAFGVTYKFGRCGAKKGESSCICSDTNP